jgi:hypothetical protein
MSYSQVVSEFNVVNLAVVVHVSGGDSLLDVDDLRSLDVQLVQDAVVALLEEGAELDVALLGLHLLLDLAVRVVDDGNEHVQQDEEDKEHIGQEEDRSEHAIGRLNRLEVKVTENDTEQSEANRFDKTKIKLLVLIKKFWKKSKCNYIDCENVLKSCTWVPKIR